MSGNEFGNIIIALLMSLLFAFLSYKEYKKSKLSNNVDMPYSPPINSTANEQIDFHKKTIYIGGVAFLLLTIIVVCDLNDLESGQTESISTFAPVVFVYQQFGYWPAVLTLPVLGLACVIIFLKKIKDSKQQY